MTLQATAALASKDEPTPATGPARPSLVERGTPTVSTLAADTASAAQQAADCEALVAAAKTKSAKKRAEMFAACKEAEAANAGSGAAGGVAAMAITYDPNLDHCVDSTKTLCANPDVFHFIHTKFEVTSSNALSVYTADLQSIAGSTPDTVLYLMKCSSSACDAGDIVAINDDIGGWPPNYASSITLSAPSSGWYAVYVVAYSAGRRGLCDLTVSQSGGVNFTYAFNGPQLGDDFCGWDETIVVDGGMTATEVNYPIEGCTTAATCAGPSAVCLIEAGTCSPTACPSQACSNGSCSCADVNGDDDDSLCVSGQCVDGRCVRAWGGCTCTVDADCPGQGFGACINLPSGRCKTYRSGEDAQPIGEPNQPWSLRDSAKFDGIDDRLQLVGGSESRMASIGSGYQNRFSLFFDFRFDGFDGSESVQVLWSSGTFQLVVANTNEVQATVGGHTALVWSGLERGRWYRVIWSASRFEEQGHFLWLRRMDPETGWYGAAGTGGGGSCVYQSWSTDLASPGDVWIGHDGSSDSSLYFHGRMDNVALVNFTSARPIDCSEQQ